MSNKRISELDAAATLSGAELLPVVQSGQTKQATVKDLRAGLGRVVDSIAALKALDKTQHSRTFVVGYYAPGDGGGGEYWLDATDTTSVDDGGAVIVASDGGRWKMQVFGAISVRQFGARGDWNGTTGTDDSDAIQAAINWAGARAVSFGTGYAYRITKPIYSSATSLHLIANEAALVKTTNTAGSTIGSRTFNGSTDDYNIDCILGLLHNNGGYGRIKVDGRLTLRGAGAAPAAVGLFIPRFFYSSIKELSTENCVVGVRGKTGILSTIENVQCFGAGIGASTHGIWIADTSVPANISTSLTIASCWGADLTTAYYLAATYSALISCAADRCGTEIYRLEAGSTTLINCATESAENAPSFYFNGGRHAAINCRAIQPKGGSVAKGIVFASNPAVVDWDGVCQNFTSVGSALRYEVNSGATLRASPGTVWATNGVAPSVVGSYSQLSQADGTFTPVVEGSISAGVGTYTAQVGRYSRVGRMVHYSLTVSWTAHTGTGSMRISGLPLAAVAMANAQFPASVMSSDITYTGQLAASVPQSTSYVALYQCASNTGISSPAIDTSGTLYISGSYEAAN